VKPANQPKSGIKVFSTKGLLIGIVLGKALVNYSVNPIEALILIIFVKPARVKCSPLLILLRSSIVQNLLFSVLIKGIV
jgi:hypothetical protein